MKLLQLFALTLLTGTCAWGQVSSCDGTRYTTFGYVPSASLDILYGNATTYAGNNQDLYLDFYEPSGDVATERPLVILAFGGSFISGTRQDMEWMCQYYTALGYATATIDYRLYDGALFPLPDSVAMTEEVLMAVSDMKASVRFFKEDAANANTYKIDTNYIFVGGISSGGITASHLALLDSNDVIESYIQPLLANNGGWTGNSSTNTQHTSDVRGLLNFSGALRKASYIDSSDPDFFSVHDDQDEVVPYAAGAASIAGFPIITMEGSFLMDQQAQSASVPTELITFPGNGHVSYFQGSQSVADSVLWESATFLYDIVCPQYAATSALSSLENVAIFPNPTSNELHVEWDANIEATVEIRNILGELISTVSPSGSATTLNMESLSPGVYIVRVSSNEGTYVQSVQKM